MNIVALLTRSSVSSQSIAFHQPVYHAGAISVAYPRPLIRQLYLGLVEKEDIEVFIVHGADEKAIITKYLPELSKDNLIQLQGDYDLAIQLKKVLDLCSELGDPFTPFAAIPVDHAVFNLPDYYRALRAGLKMAEQSGTPAVVGTIANSQQSGVRGQIQDRDVLMDVGGLSIASVGSYVPVTLPQSDSTGTPAHESWDCGALIWRAEAMRGFLSQQSQPTQTQHHRSAQFSQFIDFNQLSLKGLFVIKGDYAWFNSQSGDRIEIIPYGTPDRHGNIRISEIRPLDADMSIPDRASELSDVSVPPEHWLAVVTPTDKDNSSIGHDLTALAQMPGFQNIVRALRMTLKQQNDSE